jgi:hypothetical protein
MRVIADNAGAQTHIPMLQQHETGYGPYNNLIRTII